MGWGIDYLTGPETTNVQSGQPEEYLYLKKQRFRLCLQGFKRIMEPQSIRDRRCLLSALLGPFYPRHEKLTHVRSKKVCLVTNSCDVSVAGRTASWQRIAWGRVTHRISQPAANCASVDNADRQAKRSAKPVIPPLFAPEVAGKASVRRPDEVSIAPRKSAELQFAEEGAPKVFKKPGHRVGLCGRCSRQLQFEVLRQPDWNWNMPACAL